MRLVILSLVVGTSLTLAACGEPAKQAPKPIADVTPAAAPAEVSVPAKAEPAPAWTADTTVGAIVAARPESARVFELVGIDYCCGGEKPLGEAASEKSIDVIRLLGALAVIGPQATAASRDWRKAPLRELMDHIVATHHVWLRRELPRIRELVETVAEVHGDAHAELAEVRTKFLALQKAIGPHLEEEEQHLFPVVRKLAAGEATDEVEALLTSMRTDHDHVGAALHRISDLTGGFKVPEDACQLYKQMLKGLQDLEHDLHQHVHLENNVLLPRAMAVLEAR